MLAYVFSHRPAGGVDIAVYESALTRFHAALASAPPSGFVRSTTFKVGDGYSDWYLVDGSAALDVLNEAAVSGARTSAHDAAARMAIDGVGKLYSRQPDSSLWRRMMVLGPPPEFCLLAPSAIELPGEFRPEALRRDPI